MGRGTSTKKGPKPLAERERRFFEAFLATGNASEAARRAGYTYRADATGARMLKHPAVIAAIDEQRERLASASIASAEEVRELWTDVLRGVVKGATVSDRIRASELLAKTQGHFIDRREVRSLALTGTLDWQALLRKPGESSDDARCRHHRVTGCSVATAPWVLSHRHAGRAAHYTARPGYAIRAAGIR